MSEEIAPDAAGVPGGNGWTGGHETSRDTRSGIGSCLFSALQLGWIPAAQTHQAALAVLVLVAALELVTCIVGFLIRDVVMATGRAILPISRRGTSHYAMSGNLGHQLESLATETGVRQKS